MEKLWDFDEIGGEATAAADVLAAPEAINAKVAAALVAAAGPAPDLGEAGPCHITLPGGLYWDGELITRVEVRELTGADEEALDRVDGDVLRWVSVLLERAVVRIGPHHATPQMVRALLIGDRDALVLAIRIATFGADLVYRDLRCPECQELVDVTVDLTTVEPGVLAERRLDHTYMIPVSRGTALVRLPDGAAQERIFQNEKATVAERNSALLLDCVQKINGFPVTAETVQEMPLRDRRAIIRWIAENQPGPRLDKTTFVHAACGEEVRLPISVPELFLSA